MPNEQVDPASGTLTVVATDLVLPGNAGFNLAITRVYNSSIFPDYSQGASTAIEEDSWAGIGWKLHFGRILHADSQAAGQMEIEMGDGSRHPLYHSMGNPNIWTTPDFWLYNPATHVLQLPNGRVYTFGREVTINERLGVVRYVTEIRDPFNNWITFDYFNAPGPIDGVSAIHQYVSSTQTRDITFAYDGTLKAHASMTYLNHTWTYHQDAGGPAGYSVLSSMTPPQGPGTVYEYSGPGVTGEMTAIHPPFGGTIAYAYVDAVRVAGSLSMTTRVVHTRTMSGHNVVTGTWTFSYGTGANQDTTTIACPCGGITKYRFNGTGASGDFTGWRAGTLADIVTTEDNGTVVNTVGMSWSRSEPISPDLVSGQSAVWTDDAVYKPLLTQQTITRGTSTWTTNFSYHTGQGNYNDYGTAYFIEEIESIYRWRRTTRTFQTGFTPYIVGAVASVSTEQLSKFGEHDGTATSSTTYALATGFVLSTNALGVTTTFEPRADGNVNRVTDARGNQTTFTYSWGRVASIDTPNLDSTFVVTPEGFVTSATQGGLTTTYDYDLAFRLSAVHPPGTNAITYVPDDLHGSWVRVERGSSAVTHIVDGFGREVLTHNSQGLTVETGRDACGRVTSTSLPYGSVYQGATTLLYDALGRVKQTTDPVGKVTTFAFVGSQVQRTDANNHTTLLNRQSFGSPDAGPMGTVTDALGHITEYRYDITGGLTRVTGPSAGIQRTWVMNAKGLPDSDTQPESGTTTYIYDAVGNLASTTNANAQTTTFTYDGNNRMTFRDAPGTVDDLTIVYDTAGRVGTLKAGNPAAPTATTTFTYDVPNRTVTRTDTTSVGTFVTTSAADGNENVQSLTYPSGRIVTYSYDGENRLLAVNHRPPGAPSSTPFAQNFTYGSGGQLATYQTGAVTHQFTYEAGRPKHLWTTGGTDVLDLTYGYDNVGGVASITDPRPNATQNFVPDALDRLTSATGPWGTLTWAYDAAGNRLSETASGLTTTYTYNAATQRLTSTSGGASETFGYDNVGRVTSDGVGQYTYSAAGKLTGATANGVSTTYDYDTAGERFAKTINGRVTYTLRSGGQALTEYIGGCGGLSWSRDLVYAGGQLIGAAKATTATKSVAMTASSASVNENAGTVTLSIQLTTTGALACPLTVFYGTAAGTAVAGADFTPKTGSVTFPTGAVNGSTQSFTVPILDDGVDETNETFSAGITGVTGNLAIATPGSTTVTILDNDPPPLSFSAATANVAEAGGTAQVWITLATAAPLTAAASVQYSTLDGSAVAGSDYTATSGTATFPIGSAYGATQLIQVPITSDGLSEGNQTFSVTLMQSMSSPINAQIVQPSTITVTILDDELTPDPHIQLDAPADGTISGSTFNMGGWAIDAHATSGTGITQVPLYAYPNADESQNAIFLGYATLGGWRSDIAGIYGSQFGPSGYNGSVTLPGPGVYRVKARGWDPLAGAWFWSNPRDITVQSTPRMSIDAPQTGSTVTSPFLVGGWAIDAGAGSGTGVDAVHVWAYPNPGSGQPAVWVGAATLGGSRPDVGAIWGSPFTPSGYNLSASLPLGTYQVVVFARSTVTGTFNQAQSVVITVVNALDPQAEAMAPEPPDDEGPPIFVAALDTKNGLTLRRDTSVVQRWGRR